jgi:hypothetical protein
MDWRCDFNGRIPALQVQSSEFKPQFPLLAPPKRFCSRLLSQASSSSVLLFSQSFQYLIMAILVRLLLFWLLCLDSSLSYRYKIFLNYFDMLTSYY